MSSEAITPSIAKSRLTPKRSRTRRTPEPLLDIAQCFLRLSNLDNNVFERLGRYEMALWRQVRQTLFTLERLRWRSNARSWRTQPSWQQMTGIPPIAETES